MANNPNPKYNPSLVIISRNANGINFHAQLPLDVIIRLNGKKVISESKILDGVMVFEKENDEEVDEEVLELMENYGLEQDEAEHVKEIMDEEGLDEEEAVELKDEL